MTEDEYLKTRLDDQIEWFDAKSGWAQRRYKQLRTVEVVAAAAIPLLSGLALGTGANSALNLATGILGGLVTVIASLIGLHQYQNLWRNYRATAEALKREKFLYQTGAGPYAQAGEPFKLLVGQVEAILAAENSGWLDYTRSAPPEGGAAVGHTPAKAVGEPSQAETPGSEAPPPGG